jgi:hypothetical protein
VVKITLKMLLACLFLIPVVGCGDSNEQVGGTDLDTDTAEKQAEAARAAYSGASRKGPGGAEPAKK